MQRAATYCRKSNDPHRTRSSVESQAKICVKLAADNGLDIVGTFEDNDKSAAGRVSRPDFLKLLGAIERHEVDVVIAWETERLYRRLGDADLLFDACEEAGVRILTGEGWFDPAIVQARWSDHLSGRRDSTPALWAVLMFQSWLREQSQQLSAAA